MSGAAIIAEAKKHLGSGALIAHGIYPQKYDCSGFVVYVYKKVTGKKLPRLTSDLINTWKKVSRNNLKLGDLVFPTSNHVGLYAGGNSFIHISNDGYPKMSSINKFYTARRVL